MIRHQKHYQVYQAFTLNGFSNSFISTLAPSPINDLGLDCGIKSFENLPFGPFPATFIHAHPFVLQQKVQLVFHFPFNPLTYVLFDVVT